MSVVYIVSSNGQLSKNNELLYYKDHTGTSTKIMPDKVSQIVVFGALEITGPAMSLIMRRQISVVFLQKNGLYNGKLVYNDSKNSLLRHKQHLLASDEKFTTELCKDIVRGKLHNQYLYLQRISRKFPGDKGLEEAIVEFGYLRRELEQASTVNEIRGYEGMAANLYFSQLGKNITPTWTTFSKRTKNPPLDPVNSVLSFLYTVLVNRIDSFVSIEGLDSSIGSLHALSYGRKSLLFDLVEEFRVPIVDTLVCSLFNNGVLNKDDFRYEKAPGSFDTEEAQVELISCEEEENAVLLTEEGMKKVLSQFEKKLEVEHRYPLKDKLYSYDKILHEQVIQYKQVIGGFVDHYKPMVVT